MKMIKSGLIAFFLLVFFTSCTKDTEKEVNFNNQIGKIQVNNCSRGCYQYLISVSSGNDKTNVYYPINLRDEFKVDGLGVVFSAEIMDSSVQVYKPSEADTPIPAFTCKSIKLIEINQRP